MMKKVTLGVAVVVLVAGCGAPSLGCDDAEQACRTAIGEQLEKQGYEWASPQSMDRKVEGTGFLVTGRIAVIKKPDVDTFSTFTCTAVEKDGKMDARAELTLS